MKDCTSCKHNAERRPELREKAFHATPCYKCKPSEPNDGHVPYGPQFDNPSEKTWKLLNLTQEEYRLETFKYWLDAWAELEPCDQKIISLIIKNPGVNQSQLARKSGVSRQAVHRKVKRLKERFPGVFV